MIGSLQQIGSWLAGLATKRGLRESDFPRIGTSRTTPQKVPARKRPSARREVSAVLDVHVSTVADAWLPV